jgi:hypothetical protein
MDETVRSRGEARRGAFARIHTRVNGAKVIPVLLNEFDQEVATLGGGRLNTPKACERSLVGHTIAEVASLLGRSPSTVRGWAAAGAFGDPTARKFNRREYRIPADVLADLVARFRRGDRIVGGKLVCAPAPENSFGKCTASSDGIAVQQAPSATAPAQRRRTRGLTITVDPLAAYRAHLPSARSRAPTAED